MEAGGSGLRGTKSFFSTLSPGTCRSLLQVGAFGGGQLENVVADWGVRHQFDFSRSKSCWLVHLLRSHCVLPLMWKTETNCWVRRWWRFRWWSRLDLRILFALWVGQTHEILTEKHEHEANTSFDKIENSISIFNFCFITFY